MRVQYAANFHNQIIKRLHTQDPQRIDIYAQWSHA